MMMRYWVSFFFAVCLFLDLKAFEMYTKCLFKLKFTPSGTVCVWFSQFRKQYHRRRGYQHFRQFCLMLTSSGNHKCFHLESVIIADLIFSGRVLRKSQNHTTSESEWISTNLLGFTILSRFAQHTQTVTQTHTMFVCSFRCHFEATD